MPCSRTSRSRPSSGSAGSTPAEMLDGLGMAETTPGPLIMVVQFVGFHGGLPRSRRLHAAGGRRSSARCDDVGHVRARVSSGFFLGAPYVERLRGKRVLSAGLSAITAAVVGVILNLAVWFASTSCSAT